MSATCWRLAQPAVERFGRSLRSEQAWVQLAQTAPTVQLLDDHATHCVVGALASGDEQVAAEESRELLQALDRFAKTR